MQHTEPLMIMIQDVIRITYRNMTRDKRYAAISITGFTLGMTCIIFICLFTFDELKNLDGIQGAEYLDKGCLYLLFAWTMTVVVIVCFNYMSVTIVRSVSRRKEVGIRKVMGSLRAQLVVQFMFETFVLMIFSLSLSVVLSGVLFPSFNILTEKQFSFSRVLSPSVLSAMVGIVLFAGIAGGGYPAYYLSRQDPAALLLSQTVCVPRSCILRRSFMVIQFSIAIMMMISAAIVRHEFVSGVRKDPGVNQRHIVRININDQDIRGSHLLKARVGDDRAVVAFATASVAPGEKLPKTMLDVEDNEGNMVKRYFGVFTADTELFNVLGMTVVEGRSFHEKILTDTANAVLVNEEMVRKMKWTSAIGKRLLVDGSCKHVIGIIRDYHHSSLMDKIDPLIVLYKRNNPRAFIKLSVEDVTPAMARIAAAWREAYPGMNFKHQFLSKAFADELEWYRKRSQIVSLFAVIVVVIVCLGLLEVINMESDRRAKEIAIRRMFGESGIGILWLMVKEYMILVVIAAMIALPPGYYILDKGIHHMADGVPFKDAGLIFSFSVLVMLLVTTIIVGWHSATAAFSSPLNALKTD